MDFGSSSIKDIIMKYIRPLILLIFISASFSLSSQELNTSNQDHINQLIDSLIEQTIKVHNIPAISVGVIQNGEITIQKGFGFTKRGTKIKVDEHTNYQIASLSKMFTGIVANSLILEGKLDINQSISTYFPNKIDSKTKQKFEKITVRELLLHRSGIPRNSKSYKRKDGEPMVSLYSELNLLEDLKKIKIKKNKKFEYSNLGYAILAYILESASGLSYEELINLYVVDKYNLEKTSTNMPDLIATPYRKNKREIETKAWNTGKLTAASGIYSNVSDLTKLMLKQIEIYNTNEHEKNKNPIYLTRIKELRSDNNSSYGMGLWELKFIRGILYGHSGDMDGFASQYRFNSTQKTGVILLTSSGGKWIEYLIAEISAIIEDHEIKKRK